MSRRLRDNLAGGRDLWLFLRTPFRLLDARRVVGRWPVPRLLARFTPPLAQTDGGARADRLGRYVDWWTRARWCPLRYHCWTRALVLFELCRLEGVRGVSLVVGVRRGEADLEGHAWLERDGRPFLEPPDRTDLDQLRILIRHPGDETADAP